jgi:hypothetical protein
LVNFLAALRPSRLNSRREGEDPPEYYRDKLISRIVENHAIEIGSALDSRGVGT